jgi:capsular exopolysaccharide synthesis family protein
MILIACVIGIPLAVGAWFILPQTYTATTELRFLAKPPSVMDNAPVNQNSASYEQFVGTQLSIIQGNTILSRVLDNMTIIEIPSIKEARDPLEFLKKNVRARSIRRSELVSVSCTMGTRDEAVQILTEIVDVYMTYAASEDANALQDQLKLLRKQSETKQLDLDAQERLIGEIKHELGQDVLQDSDEANQYRAQQIVVEDRLDKLNTQAIHQEDLIAQIDALLEKHKAQPDAPIHELGVEELVSKAVAPHRQALLFEEASLSNVPSSSPRLKAAKRKLDQGKLMLSKLEEEERANVLSSKRSEAVWAQGIIAKDVDAKLAEQAKYQAKLDKYESEYLDKAAGRAKKEAELEKRQSAASSTRAILTAMLEQISRIQVESDAGSRVKRASPPNAPYGRDYKKQLMAMAMALMGGCGLAMAVGVALELTDHHIRSPKDVTRLTKIPLIASIPHKDEDPALKSIENPLTTADFPNSTTANEYRRILARLLYPEEESAEVNSLLVCSPAMGDGKTSLATNLAIAMAQANRSVLLIDLNSQAPMVETLLGLKPCAGMSEFLDDERPKEDLLQWTDFENLRVVGPGLAADKLAGRLASRRMMEFLEWADEEFDHTIIDTPPLLLMSDAKLLAPAVDGVLMVVGVKNSSMGMVRRCILSLEELNANIIGLVLNGLRRMRGGYLQDNQRMYYDYTLQQANKQDTEQDLPEMELVDEIDNAILDDPIYHGEEVEDGVVELLDHINQKE